jgi:hypothetical protein
LLRLDRLDNWRERRACGLRLAGKQPPQSENGKDSYDTTDGEQNRTSKRSLLTTISYRSPINYAPRRPVDGSPTSDQSRRRKLVIEEPLKLTLLGGVAAQHGPEPGGRRGIVRADALGREHHAYALRREILGEPDAEAVLVPQVVDERSQPLERGLELVALDPVGGLGGRLA